MSLFIPFDKVAKNIAPPEQFTFPFFYEPHALSVLAAEALQAHIEKQADWTHNFGFDTADKNAPIGKMFGVLVVKTAEGELGYLQAYSGKLNHMEAPAGFVPSVFEMPKAPNFFTRGSDEITALTAEIERLEKDESFLKLKAVLAEIT